MIRSLRPDDVERLQAVEVAAGARFRDVGMPDIAEHDPMPAATILAYAEAGRAWVATGGDDVPVGYVVVDVVEDCAHVEQITVDPGHQGRGIGRALIDEVDAWAREQGMAALTLTTFRDVPWNRPLYLHLGFRVLDEDELSPGLRAHREAEAAYGLDPAIRVCMRRDLRHTRR